MAVDSMVETGVSFVSATGQWHSHKVALGLETLQSRLEEPAFSRWVELPLTKQILAVRAVEELMLCTFRRTRNDPDYREGEEESWKTVLDKLVGEEGLERVGV